MDIQTTEINRLVQLLKEPKKLGANDLLVLESLESNAPYFSAIHLLKCALKKDKQSIGKASLYASGKLSKQFFKLEINQQAEENDDQIFEEIGEIDAGNYIIPDAQELVELRNPRREEIVNTEPSFIENNKAKVDNGNIPDVKNQFVEIETVTPDEPEHTTISKYDDEELPYTFLWWLAKTRAEHKAIFQPYATPVKQETGALQQQYVEHIFHLQTGVGIDDSIEQLPELKPKTGKDLKIIEAFLENDPQIKPPPHNKLDNENKARKSAEDHNDVVSETLANIYIEQMLYRKAIETYEKLSLKFPEKSRYFADLIKSLEKKL